MYLVCKGESAQKGAVNSLMDKYIHTYKDTHIALALIIHVMPGETLEFTEPSLMGVTAEQEGSSTTCYDLVEACGF